MLTYDAWYAHVWMDHGFGTADTPWVDGVPVCLAGRSVPPRRIVRMQQVHGATVRVVTAALCGTCVPGADALITADNDVWLLARTADCIPLLLCDPVRRVVAAVHSGREGTRQNIAGACVRRMTDDLGCRAADIQAVLGPSIFAANYPVDEAVFGLFAQSARTPQRFPWLDLRAEVVAQLLDSGLAAGHVARLEHDTAADPRFASWRRDRTNLRLVNVIGKIWVDENTPSAYEVKPQ